MLYLDHVVGGGTDLVRAVCERDLEGVVAKYAQSPYRELPRAWVKAINTDCSQLRDRYELFEAPRGNPALLLTFYGREVSVSYRLSIGISMAGSRSNLLQGTLDLLILTVLATGDLHGLAVSRRIEQVSHGTFVVKPGSLFPALHRLEQAGYLQSSWGESDNNRRAKSYRLTAAGRRRLAAETEEWTRISVAIWDAIKAV